MKKDFLLTILVPAYNEAKIIEATLASIIDYLKHTGYRWEIVVSDDGSSDNTAQIVGKYKNNKVRLVRNGVNKGKGAALRAGVGASKGDYVIFMDADLSVPLKTIKTFIAEFKNGYDAVIASRRVAGAHIEVHQPWHREVMGRGYTKLTQIVTGVGIPDFTCGFKGFSRVAAKKIFGKSKINRWAYDSEIIFLAKKYNYKIKQVPIVWKNRGDTRVRLRSVILESFADLVRVRLNDIRGVYD